MSGEQSHDAGRRLRVASYNVHACIGTDGAFSPPRIAGVLESLNADFVGIQELEDRDFDGTTVSDYLARELGMHAYRGATLMRGDSHYGNLLLSRIPAQAFRLHDISVPGPEPRGVIDVDFDVDGLRLRVLATHLGLKAGERREQADALVGLLEARDADLTLLVGDFNEWRPAGYPLRALNDAFGRQPSRRTWPTRQPLLALDRIFVAPADRVTAQRVPRTKVTRQASDHLPLVCTVELASAGRKS